MIETGLRNKVVVVTGGAAGIGRAVAARFAREGAKVAVWDVQDAAGEATAREMVAAGADARFQRVDVTSADAVEGALAALVGEWGGLDVMVANAGIVRDAQLVKWKDGALTGRMEEAQFDAVVGVNLKGVFLCGRAAAPHLVRRGGGSILIASSVVGLYGNFGQTNYAATKAAVIALTRTWARELGRHGIRVNAVAPGFIATDILRTIPPRVVETMVQRTPLPRLGRPEEVAEAYLWLASDAASFVHGAVLSVDGGLVPGT
jgi:3-oxoacyl-[acyl-carrier protein] reductase